MSAVNRWSTPPPKSNFRTSPPLHGLHNEVTNHFEEIVGEHGASRKTRPCQVNSEDVVIDSWYEVAPFAQHLYQEHSFNGRTVLLHKVMSAFPVDECAHAALVATTEGLALRRASRHAVRATSEEVDALWRAVGLLNDCEKQRPGHTTNASVDLLSFQNLENADAQSLANLLAVLKNMDLRPPSSDYKVRFALTGQTMQVKLPQGTSACFLCEVIAEQITLLRLAENPKATHTVSADVLLFVGPDEVDYRKPAPVEVDVVLSPSRNVKLMSILASGLDLNF